VAYVLPIMPPGMEAFFVFAKGQPGLTAGIANLHGYFMKKLVLQRESELIEYSELLETVLLSR
jgi:hypothetical protein